MIVADDSVSSFRINGLFFSASFAGTDDFSPSYWWWYCWIKFSGTWAWGYWDCAIPENRCKSLWNSATLNVPKLEVMGSTPTARCFDKRFSVIAPPLQKPATLTYASMLQSAGFIVSAFCLENRCVKMKDPCAFRLAHKCVISKESGLTPKKTNSTYMRWKKKETLKEVFKTPT